MPFRCPAHSFMKSNTRKLKIEETGDIWQGIKPKIRLMGKWLEQAGFAPGAHVHIVNVSPGLLELRSTSNNPT